MFKMAFRVVYRIKGRCSRHAAYNPVKDEQGGIKGGCEECHALLHAYRAYIAFREAIAEFETTVQLFIANKQARGRSGDVRRAFGSEGNACEGGRAERPARHMVLRLAAAQLATLSGVQKEDRDAAIHR
jgi:hypothetical protein